MKRIFMSMVLVLVGVVFMSAIGFSAGPPVPNYEITSLPKNAPKQLKQLLGRWQGEWSGNTVSSYIVVTKIDAKRVWLVYAWNYNDSGYKSVYFIGRLSFSDAETEIKFGSKYGAKFDFVLKEGKKILEGTRTYQQYYSVISMHKVH